MHCGLEAVLPNGGLVRTGTGAMPDSDNAWVRKMRPDLQSRNRAWHVFDYGLGPYNDSIFTQRSLGIVVKIGIWVSTAMLKGSNLLIRISWCQILEITKRT